MSQVITHHGTVKSVDGKHISVEIRQASACASCSAKQLCSSSESKEKLVDVVCSEGETYSVGDEVVLTGSVQAGLSAVVWAYVLPLVGLLAVLFVALQFTSDEGVAVSAALLGLGAYYGVLYLFRGRFSRKFSFTIKHIKKELL